MNRRAIFRQSLIVTVAVLAGLAGRALFESFTQVRLPYLLFLPCIFFTALLAGLKPAIVALIVFVSIGSIRPQPTTLVATSTPLVGLTLFAGAGLIVGLTGALLKRERSRSRAAQVGERLEQELSDAMPQIVWAARPDGTLDYYNRRWFEFIDINPESDPDAGAWARHVHPDDLPGVAKIWAESLQTGRSYSAEFRVRDGKGVYHWFLVRAEPVRDSAGAIRRWYGTCTDINERRQALDALRASEERLRLAQDAASVGTWEFDLRTGDVYWSDGLWHLLGLQKTDEKLTSAKWNSFIHPDDQGWVVPTFERMIATREREFYLEFRVIRADGVVRWITSRGQVVYDAGGTPLKAFGANQDITERKTAEEAVLAGEARFRFLVDTIPHIVWSATPEGAQDFANRRWYEFTGLRENDTPADAYRQIVHPDDVEKTGTCWASAVASGHAYECLHRVRRADGEYRWVLSQALPQRDDAGRIVRWFGTGTDVTEQRLVAEQREQVLASERAARSDAERASRMKDEFLATLSHELRTPLNAIVGWATILTTGEPPNASDLHDGLTTILRNARAQTQIIEDLLDMSRIVSGKIRLDVQRTDLAGVVQAALETVRPAAGAKGIRIQSVLDPDAGPVSGDPNRLQQVFWNLLSNAVKFTPRDGRVQVVLERVNSHLEVSITDSGEGIRPEFLPYVFDRFRQADSSTTCRHGGLGLGLAIVKQLVELHGGSVRVKSAGEKQGSTFTIALPLTALRDETAPDQTASGRTNATQEPHDSAPVQLAGVRVLVVDDEPDARALVCRLLEDCGATVTTAGSVDEAVRRVLTDRPGVVVSDIGMPEKDGYTLIKRLRALPPGQGGETPAVALTAYARSEDRVRAIRAGFQSHLVKPVEPAELIAIVCSLAGPKGAS